LKIKRGGTTPLTFGVPFCPRIVTRQKEKKDAAGEEAATLNGLICTEKGVRKKREKIAETTPSPYNHQKVKKGERMGRREPCAGGGVSTPSGGAHPLQKSIQEQRNYDDGRQSLQEF